MTHQALIGEHNTDPQPWREGIDLFREGAGESGAVWDVKPFQIVSLLEMNKFFPNDFWGTMKRLENLERQLHSTQPSTVPISDEHQIELKSQSEFIRTDFKRAFGLDSQSEVMRHTNALYERVLSAHPSDRTISRIEQEVRVVLGAIRFAVYERVFLCLPLSHAGYYDQDALFGGEIATKFPEINEEIRAAGNCYAAESYTACVFHLTRAVEIAARVMVERLGVSGEVINQTKKRIPVKLATWEQLRVALDKGVQKKQHGIGTSNVKRETYEFYNHAVSQFAYFKDAWRNKVSHKRKTYQAGETKDIMDNVKQFMVHIAQRLKEPKGARFD